MATQSILTTLKKSAFIATLAFSGIIAGCGGGGGGGGDEGTSLTGYGLTSTNAVEGVGTALGTLDFYTTVTRLMTFVDITIRNAGTGIFEADISADLCVGTGGGTASLTWTDPDNDDNVSQGDSATLTLTACDFGDGAAVSGTVTMDITASNLTTPPYTITAHIVVAANATDSVGTTAIDADFTLTRATSDYIAYTFTYSGSGAAGHVTSTEDGTVATKVGCFQVVQAVPDIVGTFLNVFTLQADALVVFGDNKVLALDSSGHAGSPLAFNLLTGGGPVSGGVDILSFVPDDQRPCAALDIGSSGVDNNGSWVRLTANDPSGTTVDLQLHGEVSAIGDPITVNWTTLVDF